MILLDSNVVIDARNRKSAFHSWAEDVIADGLLGEGVALNAVVLAELCVGHDDPKSIETELKQKVSTSSTFPRLHLSFVAAPTRGTEVPDENLAADAARAFRFLISLSARMRS